MPAARDIIDAARVQHWSFSDKSLGDGAAVLHLTNRIRTLLLRYRDAVRSLINASVQTAGVVNGLLVGIDAGGVPTYSSTVADGYALHLDGTGVPYVDLSEAPISWDPFGASGGTPGWPLPVDAIALFSLFAAFQDGSSVKVDIVDESERDRGAPGHSLGAFITGNRIVPIRPPTLGASDGWTSVTAVQLSYLPLVTIATIDDAAVIPAPLHEALTAGMAAFLAMQSKECSASEKAAFQAAARRAEADLETMAFDILGDMQTTSVIYEG